MHATLPPEVAQTVATRFRERLADPGCANGYWRVAPVTMRGSCATGYCRVVPATGELELYNRLLLRCTSRRATSVV